MSECSLDLSTVAGALRTLADGTCDRSLCSRRVWALAWKPPWRGGHSGNAQDQEAPNILFVTGSDVFCGPAVDKRGAGLEPTSCFLLEVPAALGKDRSTG